jgi:EcsC protein family
MTEEDLKALRAAATTLEHPGLAARLGNIAGKPIELVGRALPEAASEAVAAATTKALHAALAVALRTMEKEPKAASRLLHKALAAASGAVGGGFGLAALPVELPISTIIMLRSIGDIARSEGEDLADPESALACLQVFALGTRDGEANAAESGYFAARGLLAKSVAEAARFIAERGVVAEGAPVLVRFIAQIASRFELRVHRPLPRGGAGTLRRAPARTTLWQGCRPGRIRAVLLRYQSRGLSTTPAAPESDGTVRVAFSELTFRIAPGVSLGSGSVRSLAFVGQAVTNRIANATYVLDLGLQRPAVLANSNFVILQPC